MPTTATGRQLSKRLSSSLAALGIRKLDALAKRAVVRSRAEGELLRTSVAIDYEDALKLRRAADKAGCGVQTIVRQMGQEGLL
jgi:hypothetical protein